MNAEEILLEAASRIDQPVGVPFVQDPAFIADLNIILMQYQVFTKERLKTALLKV